MSERTKELEQVLSTISSTSPEQGIHIEQTAITLSRGHYGGLHFKYDPSASILDNDVEALNSFVSSLCTTPPVVPLRDEVDALNAAQLCRRLSEVFDHLGDQLAELPQHADSIIANQVDMFGGILADLHEGLRAEVVSTIGATGGSESFGPISRAVVSVGTATGVVPSPAVAEVQTVPSSYFEAMEEFGLYEQPKDNIIEIVLDSNEVAYVQSLIAGAIERNAAEVQAYQEPLREHGIYEITPVALTQSELENVSSLLETNTTVEFQAEVLGLENTIQLNLVNTDEEVGRITSLNPEIANRIRTLNQLGQTPFLGIHQLESGLQIITIRTAAPAVMPDGIQLANNAILTVDSFGKLHYINPISGMTNSVTDFVRVDDTFLNDLRTHLSPDATHNIEVGDYVLIQRGLGGRLIQVVLNNALIIVVTSEPILVGNNIRTDASAGSGIIGTSDINTQLVLNTIENQKALIPEGLTPLDDNNSPFLAVRNSAGEIWYRVVIQKDGQTQYAWMRTDAVGEAETTLLAEISTPQAPVRKVAAYTIRPRVSAPELTTARVQSTAIIESSHPLANEFRRQFLFVQTDELNNQDARYRPGILQLNNVENYLPGSLFTLNGQEESLTSQEALSIAFEQAVLRVAREQGVVREDTTLESFLINPVNTLVDPSARFIRLYGSYGQISFDITKDVVYRLRSFSDQIPEEVQRTTTDAGSFLRSLDANGNLIIDIYLNSSPSFKNRFNFSSNDSAFSEAFLYTEAVTFSILTLGSQNRVLNPGAVFGRYYDHLPGGYAANYRIYLEDVYDANEQIFLMYYLPRAKLGEYVQDEVIAETNQLFAFQ